MKRTQRGNGGFTIIELVVVIVILSILAAVALPKFADLRDDAHTATHSGVGGSLAAGMNIAHARWLVQNAPATVTLEDGTVVNMNATGWPTATDAATCASTYTNLLQAGSPPAAAAAGAGIDYVAAFAGGTCTYTYQPDNTPLRTIAYNSANGAVTVTP